MTDNVLAIMALEAREACKGCDALEERLRNAMVATKRHWLGGTENDRFKAALAGAMLESPEVDQQRLRIAVDIMGLLARVVREGFTEAHGEAMEGKAAEYTAAGFKPLGLAEIWRNADRPL